MHSAPILVFSVALMAALPAAAQQPASTPAGTQKQTSPALSSQRPVLLDRVIAIVNGTVILESDVDDEIRYSVLTPFSTPPEQNTPAQATNRLIRRALILEQMGQQRGLVAPVTDADVQKSLAELRKQLPACQPHRCDTQQGWREFLQSQGLSEQEVEQRWHQRLDILKYVDVRFRDGIQISRGEISDYYQKTIVPAYRKENAQPPSVKSLTPRIEEVLLQDRVSTLLRDWLNSLRDQGSIQILDPAYGTGNGKSIDEGEGGA